MTYYSMYITGFLRITFNQNVIQMTYKRHTNDILMT